MRSGEMDGYDAIFFSPHKFLGGPGTPGVLLMSKILYQLGSSPPSTCGGGTVSFVNGFSEKASHSLKKTEIIYLQWHDFLLFFFLIKILLCYS